MPSRTSRRHERRPSRRRTRGNSKAQFQSRIGIALIMAAVVLSMGGVWWYFYAVDTAIALDKETLCPVAQAPAEVTAILVDTSDLLTPVQSTAIRNELDGYRNAVPRYGAFEIYTVANTKSSVLEPLFRACNPGSPDQISGLTESPKRAARNWHVGFVMPLADALSKAMPESEQKTSPIIESIQSVAVTAFGGPLRKGVGKRLVIVSDMMQNTAAFSNYKSVDYIRFNAEAGEQLMVNLRGVMVDILYVRRPSAARWQGVDHIVFWQNYFATQGATITRVYSISG